MNQRLAYYKVSPEVFQAMSGVERAVKAGGLSPKLLHLVKLRASQINGCAFCIDMHWKDARAAGETEQRLYGLDAWRESPYYDERERAALEWTESLTLIAQTHAPDDVFERVKARFSERELVDLTWAVAAINAWNRVAIGFRSEAGKYTPRAEH